MGLTGYSCDHISGPHEPIITKFGLWRFFIMLYRYMVMKKLKSKNAFCDVITSVLYFTTAYISIQMRCIVGYVWIGISLPPGSIFIDPINLIFPKLYSSFLTTRAICLVLLENITKCFETDARSRPVSLHQVVCELGFFSDYLGLLSSLS